MNGVFLFLVTTTEASPFLSFNHTSILLVSTLRLTYSSIFLSHPLSHSITPFNTQSTSPLPYPHTQQDTFSQYILLFPHIHFLTSFHEQLQHAWEYKDDTDLSSSHITQIMFPFNLPSYSAVDYAECFTFLHHQQHAPSTEHRIPIWDKSQHRTLIQLYRTRCDCCINCTWRDNVEETIQ